MMRSGLSTVLMAMLVALLLGASAPATAQTQPDAPLRIGSKRFTESYILAELLAQQAAPHSRVPPQVRQGLGNTAIVLDALRAGQIDMYAEYAGTISQEILKSKQPMTLEQMQTALASQGLGVGIALGFNDGYALAVRAKDAQRLGISRLSDLAAHPQLKLGLSNEFIGRADGWKGLAARYGLPQTPVGLDHGLAYDAIAAGQIDVMDIYTTDAKIDFLGLRVLDDDQAYFPRYDAVVLYRLDVPVRYPQAWSALQKLQGRITEPMMIAMNARAELQGVAFDVIARDQLVVVEPAKAGAVDTNARGFWAKLWAPGTATAIAIGTATIAAFVGAGGFGERIVTGLALNDRELLLAGALPAALFALLSEGAFELWERRLRRHSRLG